MKRTWRKLSELIYLRVTPEMAAWLDEVGRQPHMTTRGATIRALLQTIMDEAERPEIGLSGEGKTVQKLSGSI